MNTNWGAGGEPVNGSRNVPGEIRLHFRPERTLINATREYVRRFYAGTLASSEASWRVALTTHELLENALKYSTDGLATVDIAVVYGAVENTVRIKIHNRTSYDRV